MGDTLYVPSSLAFVTLSVVWAHYLSPQIAWRAT